MKPTKYWKPTPEVYAQVQKLKLFVLQVANHPLATAVDKSNAHKVISCIETIDQPETYDKDWFVDLWIIDEGVQSGTVKEGVYLRKWSIHFDHHTLHIEAETCHTDDHTGHYGNDFSFYGTVAFDVVKDARQVFLDEDIDYFLQDAAHYKTYLTKTLNEVEIEISFG